MKQWHALFEEVLARGEVRNDRTGVGTIAIFGASFTFDMSNGDFPAVTTKRLAWKQMVGELSAFLAGCDTIEDFERRGCTIWTPNGQAQSWLPRARWQGDLGRIYGVQWRRWKSVDAVGNIKETDQLGDLVNRLKSDPHSRRHLVTAFNPGELDIQCLPPCHTMFQLNVGGADLEYLDILVSMRSVDLFLGLPFDVASYGLLLALLAKEVNKTPRRVVFMLGDTHIYRNHLEQVREVLAREPYPSPKLHLDPFTSVFRFKPEDAALVNYQCHDKVAAPLNV